MSGWAKLGRGRAPGYLRRRLAAWAAAETACGLKNCTPADAGELGMA